MTKDETEQCFSSIENKLARLRRILQKMADSSCTGEEKNGLKDVNLKNLLVKSKEGGSYD